MTSPIKTLNNTLYHYDLNLSVTFIPQVNKLDRLPLTDQYGRHQEEDASHEGTKDDFQRIDLHNRQENTKTILLYFTHNQ